LLSLRSAGGIVLGLANVFGRSAPSRVKGKLVVIPHTHWDREWYLPFQEFRFRLVRAIDEILDLLERRPDYRHFTLDGQTILLEDYLEIRPERRRQIETFVGEGRLSVGPWYVLPDQFLVSPEALVRNLLVGYEMAESFGGALRVGYLPDPFGHVSQLPQLLRGFDIDAAVLWRGVDQERASELTWLAPDGSSVLLVHLPQGYNNASVLPAMDDGLLGRLRQLAQELREAGASGYAALMNGDDHARPQHDIPDLVAHANGHLRDFELVHGGLAELVAGVQAGIAASARPLPTIHGELRSGRFAPVLPGVLSARMWLKQRNAAVETALERWAEPFAVLADLAEGSTRAPGASHRGFLRAAWRHLLQNHPHDSVTGCSVDQVHEEMRTRFDWADQIAGSVSGDSTRRIVSLVNTTRAHANGNGNGHSSSEHELPAVIVFNPEAHSRADFARAVIPLVGGKVPSLRDDSGAVIPVQVLAPREMPLMDQTYTRTQLKAMVKMIGALGNVEWTDQRIDAMTRLARLLSRGRVPNLGVRRVTLAASREPGTIGLHVTASTDGRHDYDAVRAGLKLLGELLEREDVHFIQSSVTTSHLAEVGIVTEVPALGYRVLHLDSPSEEEPVARAWACEGATIENAYFRVTVDATDGTVMLRDKRTGQEHRGLNRFVDEGEAGDEYNHAAVRHDTVVDIPAEPPAITIVESGPARATLEIALVYHLPESLADDRVRRSKLTVPCLIRTRVSVLAGVPRVDIQTEIENRVSDHRLRALFPVGARARESHAESAFWVETRPVTLPRATSQWSEQPVGTHPQRRFVAAGDGTQGLLLGVRGLPEYELLAAKGGSDIALTLLRCVGWLSRGDLAERPGHAGPMLPTPGAQCHGTFRFEYCIVPFAGHWGSAYQHAHHFSLPFQALVEEPRAGPLPGSGSFLRLEGEGVVLSALKPAEQGDGFIVRCYNTLPRPTTAVLTCDFELDEAARVNLREQVTAEMALGTPTIVAFALEPAEIATLRLLPAH
jgi:alpha-mannosidase